MSLGVSAALGHTEADVKGAQGSENMKNSAENVPLTDSKAQVYARSVATLNQRPQRHPCASRVYLEECPAVHM
jgi:hypothetical protein